jgi:hypothetical protein
MDRAPKAFSKRVIHDIAHSLVPFSRTEFRLPEEVVVYYKGSAHTCEHMYAAILPSRPLKCADLGGPCGGTTGVLREGSEAV